MRKSLLALLVAAAVAAPAAQAMFLGKSFTVLPDSPWKLEVSPSAGNGSGTAVTVLEVRGTTLAVLDKLSVAEGTSVTRSYKATTRSVGRIIITFDQPNLNSMTSVRITQENHVQHVRFDQQVRIAGARGSRRMGDRRRALKRGRRLPDSPARQRETTR